MQSGGDRKNNKTYQPIDYQTFDHVIYRTRLVGAQDLNNKGSVYNELSNQNLIIMAPKRNQLIETTVVVLIGLMTLATVFVLYLKFKIIFQK